MTILIADRVKETTGTTGNGLTITLGGAAVGYVTFASTFANNDVVYYAIVNVGNWEIGVGKYTTGTLERTTVLKSTNANARIVLSGTSEVFVTMPADGLRQFNKEAMKLALIMG